MLLAAARDVAISVSSPGPALGEMAHGLMWTYDGQVIATPEFLLGTGPAGNLVSTVLRPGAISELFVCRRVELRAELWSSRRPCD